MVLFCLMIHPLSLFLPFLYIVRFKLTDKDTAQEKFHLIPKVKFKFMDGPRFYPSFAFQL